ncbi:MAG TPA: DNA methyltransferase [Ktedonobacteraceae bacterium]|nr:DNA methyltransferase [Ktedonobacteraceae bacterium]
MIDSAPTSLPQVLLPLQQITTRLAVRRLQASGVSRLKESIERLGFLEQFPLVVMERDDGTILLIDGNHRLEAALAAGQTHVPCLIKTNLTEQECYTLALRSNSATEAIVPSTLVTYAEFVWNRLQEGYKQQAIAEMLGWSRGAVSNYALLDGIDKRAWSMIATTFEQSVALSPETVVAPNATAVAFTEHLLRDLLPLSPEQQCELVQDLASNAIKKNRFTELAKAYRLRKEMYDFAQQFLGDLGEVSLTKLQTEVSSGAYDADWKSGNHPKLEKLLAAIRDEWEQKHSIHLIQGDFYEEVQKVGDSCIDLILTDPPYNIARENEFILEGRSNISQNFGSWDSYAEVEFLMCFETWARSWARILRLQGSGYVFTSDRYISHLRGALESAGLSVKSTITWHKTNPGTQVVQTNFKSSVEYLLFFVKGEDGGHTFHWQGESEMHNFIESAICGGNERLVDSKGKTLHPTQKPEKVIRHFLEISSNRGDTVFDGFAGTGTMGKVAKDLGRKFIGVEQDPAYFEAMQRRLAE